jgi:hypothetical protein
MTVPNFYASNGQARTPTIKSDGTISYQDTSSGVSSVTITYSITGDISNKQMIRTENGTSVVIADSLKDFELLLIDSSNTNSAGKVASVKTRIAFASFFSSLGSTAGSVFYNTTLMRNARSDTKTFLY